MEPPKTLQCELRRYQKQALHWMTQLENGSASEDASRTLHPCWEAYHLAGYFLTFLLVGFVHRNCSVNRLGVLQESPSPVPAFN